MKVWIDFHETSFRKSYEIDRKNSFFESISIDVEIVNTQLISRESVQTGNFNFELCAESQLLKTIIELNQIFCKTKQLPAILSCFCYKSFVYNYKLFKMMVRKAHKSPCFTRFYQNKSDFCANKRNLLIRKFLVDLFTKVDLTFVFLGRRRRFGISWKSSKDTSRNDNKQRK